MERYQDLTVSQLQALRETLNERYWDIAEQMSMVDAERCVVMRALKGIKKGAENSE